MKKYKNKLILICILIFMFILGFLTKSIIPIKSESEEIIKESEEILNSYANSSESIDSIENISIYYYDTANIEMLHYAMNYYDIDIDEFPNYYITNFNDTVDFNKSNFFRYVALYTVADNLLESRKHIINGLLMKNRTEENNNMRYDIEK